jgi:hypothetical protein
MFELDATLGRLKYSDYETLNIRATLAATSDDERSSSSTCFSTPRSTGMQINTASINLSEDTSITRTKTCKHPRGCAVCFPYHDGKVWVVFLDDWVCGQDELPADVIIKHMGSYPCSQKP